MQCYTYDYFHYAIRSFSHFLRPEDELNGQVLAGLEVLKAGIQRDEREIRKELVKMIRKETGALANFSQAFVVISLSKTRSCKILRNTMRRIANSKEYTVPSTIDDPAIPGEIDETLKRTGYVQ